MAIKYIHVQHPNGAHDMLPERSAQVLAAAGQVTIIDPTPGPYHRFKAHVPLGTSLRPKKSGRSRPEPPQAPEQATATVATEPAPPGAAEPEEAQV